jgi:nucleoside phosphorylase
MGSGLFCGSWDARGDEGSPRGGDKAPGALRLGLRTAPGSRLREGSPRPRVGASPRKLAHYPMMRMVALAVALLLIAAGDAARAAELTTPDDAFCAELRSACVPPPYVAVISAFPAEIEPLLAAAEVSETTIIDGLPYYVGTLAGVRVVLVRGGIGLINAANTTRTLVDRFALTAIVFSGVAGSRLDIGDVAIPADWTDHSETFPVTPSLLAAAQTLASPPVVLENCALVPPDSAAGKQVCLGRNPRIVVGGSGESADPYGGKPFACVPGRGPVFGCETPLPKVMVAPKADAADTVTVDATDMETAAVARVARDAGVPFIGVRGVSDGGGDPLNQVGNFVQFFAYYRLSANNAAAVTIALLQASGLGATPPATNASSRLVTVHESPVGAACEWEGAGGASCVGRRAPRAITTGVAQSCRLTATAAAAEAGSRTARVDANRARRGWKKLARQLKHVPRRKLDTRCRGALVSAFEARAGAD